MSTETFTALFALAAAAAWSPGPNNALVASSGASFGFLRTLPHILGIALGFPLMMLVVGVFLGELFQQSAVLRETLRWCGAVVLMWMAWKVANSGSIGSDKGRPRPFSFVEAAAFQWINPKAWAMAIAITSQFISPTEPLSGAGSVAVVFVVVGLGSASTWTLAGQTLMLWAAGPRRLIWFNRTMAALIVLSVFLLFRP